ncbi:hypothetical protein PMIN06_013122 [Paraphaeosphaeria minitans]|uniref:Uncharacterized protein n=1 Tax=Paraphaeosphaeria minitans TaxID=565426 RepID=A0A9P6KNJ1_9PLEO|nr:hypothetical protein PMIN01_08754 [Paraphaeosphaeria minitans]
MRTSRMATCAGTHTEMQRNSGRRGEGAGLPERELLCIAKLRLAEAEAEAVHAGVDAKCSVAPGRRARLAGLDSFTLPTCSGALAAIPDLGCSSTRELVDQGEADGLTRATAAAVFPAFPSLVGSECLSPAANASTRPSVFSQL